MATACLRDPVEAFLRLERDYIAQDYELPPGRKTPTAAHVTERFGQNLQAFYGGRVQEVLRGQGVYLRQTEAPTQARGALTAA